jgi:acyl carrier protein
MGADGVGADVRQILETALGVPVSATGDVSREETDRWDSLMHLEIVFMLEERFGVRFSEEEIVALDSVDGIVTVLQEKNAV